MDSNKNIPKWYVDNGKSTWDEHISCNGQTADAQSIMEVLMLAATIDTAIKLEASGESGEEEEEIVQKLETLIVNKFNEKE